MYRFFSIYGPVRAIVLMIAIIILKIGVYFFIDFYGSAIQDWILLGSRVARGYVPYSQSFTNLSFIPAFISGFTQLFYGRGTVIMMVFHVLIIVFQGLYLSSIFNKNDALNSRTYIPAIVFMVLSFMLADFTLISPGQIALFVLLFMFDHLSELLRGKQNLGKIFSIGFLIALSFFIVPFTFVYFITFNIALLAFANYKGTDVALSLFGFVFGLLTFLLLSLSFSFTEDLFYSAGHFWFSNYSIEDRFYDPSFVLFVIWLIPMLGILLLIRRRSHFSNYQIYVRRTMLFWSISTIIGVFLTPNYSTDLLYLFFPPLTYVFSNAIIEKKKMRSKELTLWSFLLSIVLTIVIEANVRQDPITKEFFSKPGKGRLLVTDRQYDPDYYTHYQPSTPFYRSDISVEYLSNLPNATVKKKKEFYFNFIAEMPEKIIDRAGVFPPIFKVFPMIEEKYEKQQNKEVYILK